MERIISQLYLEYPVPKALSIWNSELEVGDLIELVVQDLDSDLEIYETTSAQGIYTQLPKNTRAVTAVKLLMPFQGNRYVKWSFDVDSKTCYVRYIPAKISYKRSVGLEDLKVMKGAVYVYIKSAVLEKMAAKEISYLQTVNLESDAGSINLDALEAFRGRQEEKHKEMKDDIMLYSNG